jgi:hypothetical protein
LCVRQSILFGWESFKVEDFDGERDRETLLWDGELDGVNKELGERTGGFLFLWKSEQDEREITLMPY